LLADVLSAAGPLRAAAPVDGEALRAGRIYVAPPDRHLMVDDDCVRITRGTKENHFRPSIDVLFRSAAYHYGSNAIGVVLSGSLSDGSSGLFAIRRLGGIAIVQDPDEALYSSMPVSAISRVDVDYTLPAREIGGLLSALVQQDTRSEPVDATNYRDDLKLDIDAAGSRAPFERGIMQSGKPSSYTCPECHGVLFRVEEGAADRFRCHTGHGFTTAALLEGFGDDVEATLWRSVKTIQEASGLLQESAAKMRGSGDAQGADTLAARAAELEERLQVLRALARERGGLQEKQDV
jgi:two-component system chemotaxis response regulator CheB